MVASERVGKDFEIILNSKFRYFGTILYEDDFFITLKDHKTGTNYSIGKSYIEIMKEEE